MLIAGSSSLSRRKQWSRNGIPLHACGQSRIATGITSGRLESWVLRSASFRRSWGHRFQVLPITGEHVEQAAELPPHHADPSDRLLIAQAYLERRLLGTQDAKIRPYGVTLLGLAAPEKPLPRDLIDIRGRIAELAEHRVSMLAQAGWGQAEALTGCARKRNRNSHRQHFPFRGVLDAPEKAGLGEIGLREQALKVGHDAVGDIKRVEPFAPLGGGAPAHTLDDDRVELVDIVGAALERAKPLVISQFGAVERLEKMARLRVGRGQNANMPVLSRKRPAMRCQHA